ncbi:serine/threonine-protein kinase [Pseudohalioglobus lutimaris]|uniref:Protein kinase domain-containing protein n=1 Tax=Pseudohalioglobus lutimaris TaxID=1737061 RepID=A0A2N5WY23_9GAMM|nr:serine/threonine-protein kinase [Pseudohalioglobus lutimaris]PLW67142.1 hypothetical protein C0039_18440 [Pseudohalioglobus lutimaris]
MTDQLPAIPGYTIKHLLGEGGMARVYLAIQRGFERPVALKIIAQELAASEEFGKRFLREARIVGILSHPHIVPVYDVGEHEGVFYMAMEILSEGDLRSRMGVPLDEAVALGITRQLASALGYAHGKGFIHRDVKPDNVLFRDQDTAVLTDFGIARTAGDSADMTQITQVQSVIGSPRYMSPEQSLGHQLDARTDIYSLGIMFYQMLTGEAPYGGSNLNEIARQRYEKRLPQLPGSLAHLQPLLDRMVAYERDQRFASCEELLAALLEVPARRGGVVSTFGSDADATTVVAAPPKGAQQPASGRPIQVARSLRPLAALGAVSAVLLVTVVWYMLRDTAGTIVNPTPQVAVQASQSALLPTPQPTSQSASPNTPEAATSSKIPTPSATEFFAFYDAVNGGLPDVEAAFISAYPGSLFADILRAKEATESDYLERLERQAVAGSARAQLVVSELYDTGWGVPMDKDAALRYAERAARGGAPFALYHQATLLLSRAQTDAERRAGLRILEQSTKQGFFLAQTVLGNYLFEGRLLGRDVDESLRLLQSAAEQGDRNALFNLGRIYDGGINLDAPDTERAKAYFSEAARLGHPQAQSYLRDPL